jgi:hypothetical protein
MTSRNHMIHWNISMSIIVVFLAGCSGVPEPTPSTDQIDKSPFTSIPCAAPCWYGLLIGKSSEAEVISKINTLKFIDHTTLYIHRMSMGGLDPKVSAQGVQITASCINPRKQCLMVNVVDDVLTEIEIVLNYPINLEEAIGYLDNPDYIGHRLFVGERIICEIFIIWESRQLVLSSGDIEGGDAVEKSCDVVRDTGKTVASLSIGEARYMSIQGIDFMLSQYHEGIFEYSGTLPIE